jgi:hypothetical protein
MPDFGPTLIHDLLLPPCETVQEARDWLDIRRQSLIPCHYSGLDFAALNVSCQDDTFHFCGHVPAEWVAKDGQMKREVKLWLDDRQHRHGSPERLEHWLRLFDWWEDRGLPVSHYRRQFQRFYGWEKMPADDGHARPERLCPTFNTCLVDCLLWITSGSPVGSVAVDFTLKPGDLVFHPEHGPVLGFTGIQTDHLPVWCPQYIEPQLRVFLAANWNWPQRAAELWERTHHQIVNHTVDTPAWHRAMNLSRLLRQSGYSPD